MNQWFKFFGAEYLNDPKMLGFTACERSCWVTLLCYASMTGGEVKHLTEHQLMVQAGVRFDHEEWNQTVGVIGRFEKKDMITLDNETYVIKNWNKRQGTALTPYERVKRYREKQSDDNGDNANDNARREENREEEIRIDKKRVENRQKFGEFKNVLLSLEECQRLVESIGQKNTNLLIEELSSYLESSGKRYKSHYATLQNWARRKFQEHIDKTKKTNIIGL